MLYIDPVECIDCGACVPVCPVSAIFALDDLPEKWADFTPRNAAYFGRCRSVAACPAALTRVTAPREVVSFPLAYHQYIATEDRCNWSGRPAGQVFPE